MKILPGLTSTRPDQIPAFIEDLRRLEVREIALFPTCLEPDQRAALYAELETLEGLRIPHVHLRADAGEDELVYLQQRFGAEAFNIHPACSRHAFTDIPPAFAKRIFVENVIELPDLVEVAALGGICPDYAHWENARLCGRQEYDRAMRHLAITCTIGCCHLSAIRPGVPNSWAGEWDHHAFAELSDLDYLVRYQEFMPAEWASLELENPLEEQLAARDYLTSLMRGRCQF